MVNPFILLCRLCPCDYNANTSTPHLTRLRQTGCLFLQKVLVPPKVLGCHFMWCFIKDEQAEVHRCWKLFEWQWCTYRTCSFGIISQQVWDIWTFKKSRKAHLFRRGIWAICIVLFTCFSRWLSDICFNILFYLLTSIWFLSLIIKHFPVPVDVYINFFTLLSYSMIFPPYGYIVNYLFTQINLTLT